MNIDFEDLFPEDLTDETARAISELLHQVADHFDRTFIDQILRAKRKSFMMGVNPKRPWEPLK
ncbi:MAG: hypothetical protein EBY15_08065 [Gammaproteobacteria bacterium]|nr:hypothetical protein [Gammaproteobacteria bacterium]